MPITVKSGKLNLLHILGKLYRNSYILNIVYKKVVVNSIDLVA